MEVINARLARAAEEASGMEAYDYLLINDDLDRCVEEMHQPDPAAAQKNFLSSGLFKQDERRPVSLR